MVSAEPKWLVIRPEGTEFVALLDSMWITISAFYLREVSL